MVGQTAPLGELKRLRCKDTQELDSEAFEAAPGLERPVSVNTDKGASHNAGRLSISVF